MDTLLSEAKDWVEIKEKGKLLRQFQKTSGWVLALQHEKEYIWNDRDISVTAGPRKFFFFFSFFFLAGHEYLIRYD